MKKLITLSILATSALSFAGAPPKSEDLTELIEGKRLINSLTEIRKIGLEKASTGIDVWSGSYWPHYMGLVAARYLDSEVKPMVEAEYRIQWKQHKENFDSRPAYSFSSTDTLSPAEKYDLLVGDPAMSLTSYSWSVGAKAGGETSGKVPTWRGLCDGWASAAQMMPRPTKEVIVNDPQGKPIRFFPEDLKALGSLLYARAQINPIFLGKRCSLPMARLCGDTNPATFHLALTNRVGALKKSFVADVSPGSEVWNYPVRSYEISYYNVFDKEESKRFEDVMESFDKKKKFSKRGSRHKETAYIVGVKAVVSFGDLQLPYTSSDKEMSKTYNYDLELNSRFEILGGEGVSSLPDFIWAPKDSVYPETWVEKSQGRAKNAEELIRKSQESAKNGQPLTSVIERLFEASR